MNVKRVIARLAFLYAWGGALREHLIELGKVTLTTDTHEMG